MQNKLILQILEICKYSVICKINKITLSLNLSHTKFLKRNLTKNSSIAELLLYGVLIFHIYELKNNTIISVKQKKIRSIGVGCLYLK